jgi:hypothetical protein
VTYTFDLIVLSILMAVAWRIRAEYAETRRRFAVSMAPATAATKALKARSAWQKAILALASNPRSSPRTWSPRVVRSHATR